MADGQRVERRLAGGENHRFVVALKTRTFARVRVQQQGIDVILRYAPEDQPARVIDSMNGAWGYEVLSLSSSQNATAEFTIEAGSKKAPTGTYVLEVEVGRLDTKARTRLEADAAMESAYHHFGQQNAESFQKALEAYRTAADVWQHLGDRERQAEALFGLGVCQRRRHRGEEALRTFEKALEIFHERGDDHRIARTINQIGRLHSARGDNEAALASFQQVLASSRSLEDPLGEAQALNNVATRYHEIGDVHRALDHYLRARQLFQRLGEEHEAIRVAGSLASAYSRIGEVHTAFDLHHQVLAKARELGDLRLQAKTLNNVGFLHRVVDEPQEALTRYHETLGIVRKTGDRALESIALNNLGFLYHHLGQPSRGLEFLESALDSFRRIGDRDGEAGALTLIGEIRTELGEFETALQQLSEALAIRRETVDRDGEAVTRMALGMVRARLGDPAAGLAELDMALEIQRRQENPRRSAATLLRLGRVHAAAGKPDAALAAFDESLAIHRDLGAGRGTAEALHAIATLEVSQGLFQSARERLEAAVTEIESSRARVLDPDLRTTFFGSQRSIYELYVEVLMRLAEDDLRWQRSALEASERARARTLIDLLAETRGTIRRGVDPQLTERRRQVTRQLNARAARLSASGTARPDQEDLRREIRALVDELREIDVEIRRLHPRFMSLLETPEISTRDIMYSLADDDALMLEYALGTRASYVWAVTATDLKSFTLPPRATIEELARRVYRDISRLSTETRESGCRHLAEIGRMLLGPVAEELGDRRLIIVPDGILHYLPFAAFGDPRADNFGPDCQRPSLIERHRISTLPSAAALLELRGRSRDRRPAALGVAIIADPVFRSDDPRILEPAPAEAESAKAVPEITARIDLDLDRLPWTRREAQAISAGVGEDVFQALDFAANRELTQELGDYRILHFATHGVLDNRQPELSGLALSLVDEKGRFEDGFLRLHDIYNLDLNAELVVLSGCQTALGREIRGEGLVGLTRGFFYAGSARVLASLWRIDDRATAQLMGRFYTALLQERLDPASALRHAQRSMRAEARWQHPFYWAGFSLQGEWLPQSQSSWQDTR